jgi:putative membrane protein
VLGRWIIKVIVNALAIGAAVWILPQVELNAGPNGLVVSLLVLGLIFGLINTYLKPILKALSFPISLLTLGLFGIVVNIVLVLLMAALGNNIGVDLQIAGWPKGAFGTDVILWAFLTSLVTGIVGSLLGMFVNGDR